MSSRDGTTVSLTPREQRREERKRRRNAQETAKQPTSEKKKDKTPGKDSEKKKKTDFSASNGSSSAHKKPPSGAKRVPTYDKVNIIEKTPKFESTEKENKGIQQKEASKPETTTARRKLGSKFLDNLSKFESRTKDSEDNKKTFVRSHSGNCQSSTTTASDQSSFRRSYRPSRSTPAVSDPTILMRRSLRKERVLESIAKLEKQSTTTTLKEKTPSPNRPRSESKGKITSRPSSASSSKTSISDSGSSTSSTKGLSRAQQALERHKNRIRSSSQTSGGITPSPTKPSSPASKARSQSIDYSRKTPNKSKTAELQKTSSFEEPSTRKVSVTKSPLEGDGLEVTMVTEVMTPAEGKMNVVVTEHVLSEEEAELLISPPDGSEYQPGDSRPVSVEEVVALFDLEDGPPPSPEPATGTRARRKLPEIPVEQPTSTKKSRRSRRKSPKNQSPDGSTEQHSHSYKEQEVVVIETSPTFQQTDNSDVSSPKADQISFNFNQNSSNNEPLKHDKSLKQDKSLKHKKSSKRDQKSPKQDQKSLKQDQKSLERDQKSSIIEDEGYARAVSDTSSHNEQIKLEEGYAKVDEHKTFNPEDAIQVLQRLSVEIDSQPIVSNDRSFAAEPKVEEQTQEKDPDSLKDKTQNLKKQKEIDVGNNRPTSLHIEEVLYITDDRPKSLSPVKGQEFSPQEVSRTLSPQKSPKSERKRRKSRRKHSHKKSDPEVLTSFSKQSPPTDSSPPEKFVIPSDTQLAQESQRSPTKTQEYQSNSQSETPQSPVKYLVESFSKTSSSPIKTPSSPVKTTSKTPSSPVKTSSSPVKTPSSPIKTPSSPIETLNSPIRTPSSPIKIPSTSIEALSSAESNTPSSPIKTPSSPIEIQSSPIETPSSPIETPSSPIETPSSPIETSSSPIEIPSSPIETPSSPTKTPSSPIETPSSPIETSSSPIETPSSPIETPSSPTKTPGSSIKTPSSPIGTPDSPIKTLSSPIGTPDSPIRTPSSQIKTPSSPEPKSPGRSSRKKSSSSRKSSSSSDKKLTTPKKSPKNLEDSHFTFLTDEPSSPVKAEKSSITSESASKSTSPKSTKSNSSTKMMSSRKKINARRQKSWLDESDTDDSTYILSDAASDASDIDLAWLGVDSDKDSSKKKKDKPRSDSNSSGVQRTASKAKDMLKMWEKKAAEPKLKPVTSPMRQPSKKLSSSRAAWEQRAKENGAGDAKDLNGHEKSEKSISPLTPRSQRSSVTSSPNHSVLRSSSDWKLQASDEEANEIEEIFDEKVSGKIQGAKALFENLAHSPKRSQSFNRPVRKLIDEKPAKEEKTKNEIKPSRPKQKSIESSPIVSRKTSLSDSSSISLSSDSSGDESDLNDDSPKVDNMRAMFENQAKKKQDVRKHRSSSPDEEPKQKTKKKQSNIQKKVAAKKKGRRSMTQPVTSDDVIKAKDMMNGNNKTNSAGEEEEDQPLNFVDRLKFFNQLGKSTGSARTTTRVRRRSDTQPAKSSLISKAAESIEASNKKNEKQKSIEVKPLRKISPNENQSQTSPSKPSTTEASKSQTSKPAPITTTSTPVPTLSPKSPTVASSIQRLTHKFSVSSSSDSESLLSSSSTSIEDTEPGRKKVYLSEESSTSCASSGDMSVDVAEIKSTGSIHDRLKRLQQNQQEEKWRKQNRNSEIKSSVSERLNKLKSKEEKWKKTPPVTGIASRAEKLSDRIAKMKEDAETWKEKSGKQNDASQFTVHAKLAKREGAKAVAVFPSPSIKRRVLPVIVPSHASAVTVTDAKSSDDSSSMNQLSSVERLANKGLEENVIKKTEVFTTEVPEFDQEEFEKFFVSSPEITMNGSDINHEIDDLPQIENASKLSDIGRLKSGVQQKNKRKSSARNPLKVLAKRVDLKQSYDTERSNIARLEQQRIAQRGYGANFTSAALAGLAAKADLKNVSLRSAKNTPMPSSDDLKPFKDVMLLRAKGRRQVQTRLVEPCPSSLCTDDAFLLVTPNKLYGWFGEFCNVIERAKINEIADYIVIKGDLGCKVSALKTIEEDTDPKRCKEFWDFLGGAGEWQTSPSPGADEQYEIDVATTIKTYKMIDSKLVPHEEAWGKFPKMGMLGSSDTYVFDFGAEMYIWQGKEVSFADRRLAVRLARVIWEKDYDYTEHGISPFHSEELKGKRPDWALFARVNENLETSLFQEKFEDWSNIYREVGQEEATLRESNRGKEVEEKDTKSSIALDLQICDVKEMREKETEHLPIKIEGCDISRGDGEIVDEDGRILEIVTSKIETFYVTESNVEPFDDSVFHQSNSYLVKWKYSISSTGKFENSKETSSTETSSNGRERVAYFSWVGSDAAVGDKGASAIIASSMDTDDGPIINIEDATAPPVFNKCFHGKLVVMEGKRGVRRGGFNWRLFRVKGQCEKSASLVEVPCDCRSLRSCSSFVNLHPRDATAIVWHGCRSPKNVREAAEAAINKLSERMPGTIPFRRNATNIEISVCEEASETDSFWESIGVKRRNRYECLIDVSMETRVARAWNFTVDKEQFVAKELPLVEEETLFPIVKEQLLDVETPCLILVDSTHGTFLWQNCDSKSLNASAKRRWDVIRRLAMETTLKYCEEHNREEALLIEAGIEPAPFTNAFPTWKTKEKTSIDKMLTQKPQPVTKVLKTLTQLTYSIEELRGPDLPDGVDARHLESYLTNSDFENLFEMSKKEFYELPSWKQKKLRQQKNFF